MNVDLLLNEFANEAVLMEMSRRELKMNQIKAACFSAGVVVGSFVVTSILIKNAQK